MGALPKLHTMKLPDEWHLRLCHNGHAKVVKASQISPGLADKGSCGLVLHRHWYLMVQQKQQHRVSFPELRSHYCIQSALFIPKSLIKALVEMQSHTKELHKKT